MPRSVATNVMGAMIGRKFAGRTLASDGRRPAGVGLEVRNH
jgi:hypothetical protein